MASASHRKQVGIVGSGMIGRQWALLFAAADYDVIIYDVMASQLESVPTALRQQLDELQTQGLMRGRLTAAQQLDHITTTDNLQACLENAYYVQECVPENPSLKREVFQQIDAIHNGETIVGSSTSTILPSTIMAELNSKDKYLVAHPVNPPLLVPLVELVPSPWTSQHTMTLTRALMTELGQSPVVLHKEVPGFAVNRLQYALLVECANMVEEGTMSCEDIDKVMSEGLGLRYAFMGPLLTAHLNAPKGWKQYMELYGAAMNDVLQTFNPPLSFRGAGVDQIVEELMGAVPPQQLDEKRTWRNEMLANIIKLKRDQEKKE